MLCSSFLQLTTFTSHSAKDRCSSCDVTHWFVKFWSQTRVEHFHHHHLDVFEAIYDSGGTEGSFYMRYSLFATTCIAPWWLQKRIQVTGSYAQITFQTQR